MQLVIFGSCALATVNGRGNAGLVGKGHAFERPIREGLRVKAAVLVLMNEAPRHTIHSPENSTLCGLILMRLYSMQQ